jgi:oligosaccharide 4-alpha-D-glucosyltransferase
MMKIIVLIFLSLTQIGIFAQSQGFYCGEVHPSIRKFTWYSGDPAFQHQYSDVVLLKDNKECIGCMVSKDSVFIPSLSLKIKKNATENGFLISLNPNEEIFGGGGRALPVSRRGKAFPLNNNPWYGYGVGADHLNFSVPFFISSAGYGLFFDNPSKGYADLGKKDPSNMEVSFTGGALNVYIIEGKTTEDILKKYHELTGTQEMPPKWAFGLFMSRFGYRSEKQVTDIAKEMDKKGFPYDAVIFDLFWFGDSIKSTMGNLSWVNKKAWPNPEKMIRNFAKKDKKTILITEPYVLKTSLNYDVASPYFALDKTDQPYVLKDFYFGNGGLIDIFRPESGQWFLSKYEEQIKMGVSGWWGDLGEPERHPEDMLHQISVGGKITKVPSTHVHNLYGHEWTKMLYRHYAKNYPRYKLFSLNRAGFAGSQRYGIIPWTGDVSRSWDGFRAQIPLLTGMALSGIPYIHSDAGGFALGDKDPELYTRWYQFSVFTPILRPHGTAVYDVDPGAVSYPSEPALIGGTWEKILQKYTMLRYEMLPHNYHLAFRQYKYGEPLISPMVYYFPEDKNCSGSVEQYMWGKDILVAPVMEKNQKRKKLYLPEGFKWYTFQSSFYEGKPGVYSGWQAWNVENYDLPVFVKEGSFIVLHAKKSGNSKKDFDDGNIEIHYYYSSQNSTSEWYDDDGNDKLANQEGLYDLLGFFMKHEGALSQLEIDYKHKHKNNWREKRKIKLFVHGLPENKKIHLNGKMVKPDKKGAYTMTLTKGTKLSLELK